MLAIGTLNRFNDGESIYDVIETINDNGAVPILPWGVGKWLGKRGRIVKNIICINNNTSVYLGDNRNRPIFWPKSRLYRIAKHRGIDVFPGSDPLPFAAEYCRVGSFGFSLNTSLFGQKPANSLKNLILNPSVKYQPYGHSEHFFPFLKNQLALLFKSRF
jgi:hypothetical protein